MSSESAVKSFHKLFPNLKVISAPFENGIFGFDTPAPTLSRDFIAAYQQSLQCLQVRAISWTRSAPQSFCELTCMTVDNSTNVRLSEKTYPSLRSLKTGAGIEKLTRYLPAKLLRLEFSVKNIIKIGKADFAANLTHLRLNVLCSNLSSDLSFPNLRSLILKGEVSWNSKMSSLMRNLTTHLKAPKLKYLGIFSYYCRLVELVFVFSDIFCFFRNGRDTEPVIKFLTKCAATGRTGSLPVRPAIRKHQLDMVLKTQPNIKMLYWKHFSIKSEILKKLLRLRSLRIFGSEICPKQRESLRKFFQAPLMHQLTHFHAITCSRWTSGDEKISDVVEQEINKLEERQLKVATLNGYMQDVFMHQLKLLKLCC